MIYIKTLKHIIEYLQFTWKYYSYVEYYDMLYRDITNAVTLMYALFTTSFRNAYIPDEKSALIVSS